MPEREEQRQPTPEDAALPPGTVISTILCVQEVDKEGHVLRSFCVTRPGAYPASSGTPPTPREDSPSADVAGPK